MNLGGKQINIKTVSPNIILRYSRVSIFSYTPNINAFIIGTVTINNIHFILQPKLESKNNDNNVYFFS